MSTIMTRDAAEFWWGKKLSPNIIHLYRNHSHEEWIPYTWQEHFEKRTQRQESRLSVKRKFHTIIPAFIWVFYNNTTFFGGWFIYVRTLRNDYSINFRDQENERLVLKAMEMFPCGVIPMAENFKSWARSFVKEYPHVGFSRKNNQGLLKCYCEIDQTGQLVDLFAKNPFVSSSETTNAPG